MRAGNFGIYQGSLLLNFGQTRMTKDELDWIEGQARLNMDFHLKNMEALAKEAHITLSILLLAIPASFTYGLKLWSNTGLRDCGGALVLISAYLVGVAIYLSSSIKARDVAATANEPMILRDYLEARRDEWENDVLSKVREGELANLQSRIEQNRQRTDRAATVINTSRAAIVWAPVWFLAAWVVAVVIRTAFLGQPY